VKLGDKQTYSKDRKKKWQRKSRCWLEKKRIWVF